VIGDAFAIETHLLTRCYESLRAVDGLDLQVPYGVIFGLLGSNGAGKTTTLKMLTTLIRPSSGCAKVAPSPAVNLSACASWLLLRLSL